jgi:hypothetical protein
VADQEADVANDTVTDLAKAGEMDEKTLLDVARVFCGGALAPKHSGTSVSPFRHRGASADACAACLDPVLMEVTDRFRSGPDQAKARRGPSHAGRRWADRPN